MARVPIGSHDAEAHVIGASDRRARARPDEVLRELLSGGAQHSRDVVARLVALQFTPKQVRGARERLKVVARRAGSGRAMHTTWELPSASALAKPETETETRFVPRQSATSASADRLDQLARPDGTQLSEGEHRRVARRIEHFKTKGLTGGQASRLALLLALERDRAGRHVTSCAECQNFNDRGECRAVREGCSVAPRGVFELWNCYLVRLEIR